MSDAFGQEGMTQTTKIAIGIGAGVVVVAILVGGFLLIRSRAAVDEGATPSAAPPSPVSVGGEVGTTTPAPLDEEAERLKAEEDYAKYLEKNPPKLIAPPEDIRYDVEIVMTDAEKREQGYPVDATVVYKWVRPDPESGSPAPIKLITRAPEQPIDSDADGITDANESRYGTDPGNRDTDGDGLMDGYEVNRTKTDPTKADSDGDGVQDKDTTVKK